MVPLAFCPNQRRMAFRVGSLALSASAPAPHLMDHGMYNISFNRPYSHSGHFPLKSQTGWEDHIVIISLLSDLLSTVKAMYSLIRTYTGSYFDVKQQV